MSARVKQVLVWGVGAVALVLTAYLYVLRSEMRADARYEAERNAEIANNVSSAISNSMQSVGKD